jgi:hypothetical protein
MDLAGRLEEIDTIRFHCCSRSCAVAGLRKLTAFAFTVAVAHAQSALAPNSIARHGLARATPAPPSPAVRPVEAALKRHALAGPLGLLAVTPLPAWAAESTNLALAMPDRDTMMFLPIGAVAIVAGFTMKDWMPKLMGGGGE